MEQKHILFCFFFFHLSLISSNGNNRVVRLWLDTGGRYIKISIDEKVLSSVPVDIGRDVWRHICLSYQSDHGAWALYMDSRLVSCEAAQSLYSRVLPGGGSIIIGYGIANNGIPNGLEGEIFGVNIILSSTIERNFTIKSYPQFKQKTFNKNKVIGDNALEYVVLGEMKTEKLQKRVKPNLPAFSNASRSNYIKQKTPYSFIEHDVGLALSTLNAKPTATLGEKEVLDISDSEAKRTNEKEKINFWKLINEAGNIGNFKNTINNEISSAGTQSRPKISEYETPPPPGPVHSYTDKAVFSKSPLSFYDVKPNNIPDLNKKTNKLLKISDTETPPPPDVNTKVYGQWTSSQFASSVLNYLKSINFNPREQKKVPPTIPLFKISDSLPYASDIIKMSKVRPSIKFQRRNFMNKRLNIKKRDAKYPEINVQILQDNLRDQIIVSHAKTLPQHVEVTSRGHSMTNKEHRFYRNVQSEQSDEESFSSEVQTPRPFSTGPEFKIKKFSTPYKNHKLVTILPFLKTLEYYVDNLHSNKKETTTNTNDMLPKSLSNGNKWHNVKSYNNDYTPRKVNMNSPVQNGIKHKLDEVNKKLPSIRLKYKPSNQKVEAVEDVTIVKGRNLASEVSNLSNHNVDSVSLLKYNHGFLPGHDTKLKSSDKVEHILKGNKNNNNFINKNNFNKKVKLGNALNERNVIGHNEEQNKRSFVGGDETVPDINRYRSDVDRESESVPASLGPRICKNVELYDRLFYVQPDGSIDVTHILSPVREKNIGIEFIMQNYKKCSLENTALEKSSLLLIDWNKTPVRLFGGAYPRKTTDLCGFF